ncbi:MULTISPECIES: cytochrome b562 [unclassified Salinivibrio]|uniref:cytochrome b562 n=1 Tax=unclassified Salinivibrio TaxID=2636825 RepID=UPI00128C5DA5|nr:MULTISPECIES: cytochrome b562 [unclassified Salinivibrio]MPS30756.1 cytochrome b562 family protein [Salinivibrio sp. VYel7]MPX92157.1 cytochrome b562 family protein [Salinivibrio sp. VYel9]MPX97443.1 cytochrome b562 family protein [Salinivibrio sp. VYel6]MPX98389.1 cytochrome b562 family protein [Salinivibrio sp. VYel4]MPY01910.1 cytochrome b562 family protein [Salinivibrio sp. VYel5]
MKKVILAGAVAVLLSLNVSASELKPIMKEMKMTFKEAASAQSIEAMQAPVAKLETLIAQAKAGSYPPEKAETFMEGFDKLAVTVEEIDAALSEGDLDKAQQGLRQIDALREEYHDKRNPSIWQRLFG